MGRNRLIRQQLNKLGITSKRLRSRVAQDFKGLRILQQGDTIENLSILQPDSRNSIFESSTTVNTTTPLSDLLQENAGVCALATCTEFRR